MKRIKNIFKKLNILSIFFFAMSLISMTFAWFAFSKTVNSNMELDVKSWNIDIKDGENFIEKEMDIEISDFKPGMEMFKKDVIINNTGDLPAKLSFEIKDVNILDEEYFINAQEDIREELAQDFPFSFNFNFDTEYLENGESTYFNMSVSWPLDSLNDELDTEYGNIAYEKQKYGSAKIFITIVIKAEQYIEGENKIFMTGDTFFYNEKNKKMCETFSYYCNKFIVMEDSLQNEETVKALHISQLSEVGDFDPNMGINIYFLIKLLSKDVYNTEIVRSNASNRILGYQKDDNSIKRLLDTNPQKIIASPDVFNMFGFGNTCYWTNFYNPTTKRAYAVIETNGNIELYQEDPGKWCNLYEEIEIEKKNLKN